MTVIATAVHYTDYGPLITIIVKDLHIPSAQAGLLSTTLFLGLAIIYLPAGMLVDRYGQRPVLLGALFVMTLGGVLLPLWPQIIWILVCRILVGCGSGAAFIAGAGIVAGMGKWATLAQGIYGGCVQIGSGAGLLLTPWLANLYGWQGAFLCWGLVGVPPLLFWLMLRESGAEKREQHIDIKAGLRSPAVWSLGLSHMGAFGVGNVIAAWVSVYLVSQYNLSPGLAALFGASGLIAGAVLRPLGGILLERKIIGSIALLRVCTLLVALGIVLLVLPQNQPLFAVPGLSVLSIGSALPYAAVFGNAAQLRTVSSGVAHGLLNVIACQPLLWGPPLVGYLYQLTGAFTLPFGLLLFFCSIAINAAMLAGPAYKHERRT